MQKVIVSRKWNSPEILVEVTSDGISLEMSLANFLESVVSEAGSPAFVFSQATLLQKLQAASTVVISEIKDASKYVV